jgi:hypothetical protein
LFSLSASSEKKAKMSNPTSSYKDQVDTELDWEATIASKWVGGVQHRSATNGVGIESVFQTAEKQAEPDYIQILCYLQCFGAKQHHYTRLISMIERKRNLQPLASLD